MFGLKDIRNLISSSFSGVTRKAPDVHPHFVPLDLKALNASLGSIIRSPEVGIPDINLSKFRDHILNYLKSRYKNKIVLAGNNIIVNGQANLPLDVIVNRFTPAIVYLNSTAPQNLTGVLYSSYGEAASGLLNEYLNKEAIKFLDTSLKVKDSKFDLGYILRNEGLAPEEQTLGNSIRNLFGILNSFSQNTINVDNVPNTGNKAGVVQTKIVVETLLESYGRFKTSGPIIHASISKDTASFIKTIRADIIIIQDQIENPRIAQQIVNSQEFKTLGKVLGDTVITKTSFFQSIKNNIISKFLGTKPPTNSKESAKINPIDLRSKSKATVTSHGGVTSNYSVPPSEISLSSLQAYFNDNLAWQVERNMGTGDADNVLNYRSGRLAESFKVTAISQERSGALTAFYTYMKFPYITFGPGGAQSKPASRDPKLLGSQSIRELAVGKVTTRLRTVMI